MSTENYPETMTDTTQCRVKAGQGGTWRIGSFRALMVLTAVCVASTYLFRMGGGVAFATGAAAWALLAVSIVATVTHTVQKRRRAVAGGSGS